MIGMIFVKSISSFAVIDLIPPVLAQKMPVL